MMNVWIGKGLWSGCLICDVGVERGRQDCLTAPHSMLKSYPGRDAALGLSLLQHEVVSGQSLCLLAVGVVGRRQTSQRWSAPSVLGDTRILDMSLLVMIILMCIKSKLLLHRIIMRSITYF